MLGTPYRKCMYCRERAFSPARLPTYTTELEHDGGKYTVVVEDFRVLQCQRSGAIVLDDPANERLDDALRAAAGTASSSRRRSARTAKPPV